MKLFSLFSKNYFSNLKNGRQTVHLQIDSQSVLSLLEKGDSSDFLIEKLGNVKLVSNISSIDVEDLIIHRMLLEFDLLLVFDTFN